MTAVVTFGEALVAVRTHGRLSLGAPMSATPAGAEMNVAIGLARLGHDARWVGALGVDPAGDLVARTLRAEGVDTVGVRRDATAPTGLMLVDMPVGLPPIVTYHRRDSAGSQLSEQDVADLGAAQILHVSGVTPALSATARRATSTAIDAARTAGTRVSFDVNFRAKLWPREEAAAVLAPLAARADIVIASEDELALVTATGDEAKSIAALLEAGVREVVVKRGSRGADHTDANGVISCSAHPANEVNSIGAGDAFTAGYLSGLLDGLPVRERMRRGAFCGALAVSGHGDWEQAPFRADLASLEARSSEAAR
ncbi:sugar kinase [Microbacterium sp. NPDC089189]|uniref:sugar kinase n=1 Tax=Microbacterium sp. NPDC089189 TaxID=3154972 RepID=UPI0034249E13